MPPHVRDFYDILGLKKSASADDIRSAYRTRARKLHPDVNKSPDAAKTFAELQQAYEVLSDEGKRAQYDRFGPDAFGPGAAPPNPRSRAGQRPASWDDAPRGPSGTPFDFSDDDDVASMFDTIFGQATGQAGRAKPKASGRARARAQAYEQTEPEPQDIRVDFLVAATGGQQNFTLRDHSGTGTQSVAVKVPAGTRDGAMLRVPGIFPKSPTPDVLVRVRVQAHDIFRRSEDAPDSLDVVLDLPLTIAEATLGATVDVPTLHGRVSLTIPAGTASGRKLRLRGMGMNSSTGTKGDLVAICQIVPPSAPAISELEKDVLRRIANLGGNPRVGKAWQG